MNNNNELNKQFDISPYLLDVESRYPLSLLVSHMIHAAGLHIAQFGLGVHDMMAKGIAWVLSRMAIDFDAPINTDLPIDISTGLSHWSGLTTDRVIRLSQNGSPIGEVLSKWVAINIDDRSPIPINQILCDESIKSDYSHVMVPVMPMRLWRKDIDAKLESSFDHLVRYSDLDINNHVNTSVWIRHAMDAIPIELIQQREIKTAHIRFIKEAHYGDLLNIERYHTFFDEFIQVSCRGLAHFQLHLEWHK